MIDMEILAWLPIIDFTWTATAVIWLAALVIAAMLSSSGLSGRHKGAIVALSVGGSLALAWA
ncbi:MAG: hypothetical protein LC667_11775, partial [Thioalkalivibrio sp.]|nr:hypothetical protein [Thioalkalivibrio sp.]